MTVMQLWGPGLIQVQALHRWKHNPASIRHFKKYHCGSRCNLIHHESQVVILYLGKREDGFCFPKKLNCTEPQLPRTLLKTKKCVQTDAFHLSCSNQRTHRRSLSDDKHQKTVIWIKYHWNFPSTMERPVLKLYKNEPSLLMTGVYSWVVFSHEMSCAIYFNFIHSFIPNTCLFLNSSY